MFRVRLLETCGCDPQTQYECGGMGFANCRHTRLARFASVALCESRHEIPQAVDGCIFGNTVEFNIPKLNRDAYVAVKDSGVEFLTVYVTGMTPALVAVINACNDLDITLTLMHYNNATGKYVPQYVS